MTKHVDPTEVLSNVATDKPKAPTKREKLTRLAEVIRAADPAFPLYLIHALEYTSPENRATMDLLYHEKLGYVTAFALGLKDKALREMGYGSIPAHANVQGTVEFFELDTRELHEFSCDCGGHISNSQMADRIQAIADGRPTNHNPGTPPTPTPTRASSIASFLGSRPFLGWR